jgi:hypothetical protein
VCLCRRRLTRRWLSCDTGTVRRRWEKFCVGDQYNTGTLRGVTRNADGRPLPEVQITIHSAAEKSDLTVVTGSDGAFLIASLKTGKYKLTTKAEGFAPSSRTVDVTAQPTASVDVPLVESIIAPSNVSAAAKPGFFRRLAKDVLQIAFLWVRIPEQNRWKARK